VALLFATDRYHDAGARAVDASGVQHSVDHTLQAVLDMETGLRAYLLDGDREVLAPWHIGRRDFETHITDLQDRLEAGTSDTDASRIGVEVREYIRDYAQPLIDRRSAHAIHRRYLRSAIAGGKERVDRIRDLVQAIQIREASSARDDFSAATSEARTDRTIAVGALIAGLVLLLIFAALIRRGLLQPLRTLRTAAERLSIGDLSTRLSRPMAREFAPVHSALNDMAGELAARDQAMQSDLEAARLEVLHRLARATEFRDDDTFEHTERVGETAAAMGAELGLSEEHVGLLRLAAPLHDVGKVAIPDSILHKPGKLTQDEYWQMQRHTTFGSEMLSGSPSPVLQMAEKIALSHHERWDGAGYPLGLSGDDIPLTARIVAVADVFDALTHERPYKPAWTRAAAITEIVQQAGCQFDPAVVQAFLAIAPGEPARRHDPTRN
jgi:HD-GYP domain-containing protein (c-di-GMP phosphodiesterase class II)